MAEENLEVGQSNDLENLLSPFCYVPETPLPKTIPEVPGGLYISGFISQDCTWGCHFNQSVIQCFPVDRYFEETVSNPSLSGGSQVAVSSTSYTFTGATITCATELAIHNQKTSSGGRKLLLGISHVSPNNNGELRGALVIFDPIWCVPVKWINLPDPVSSVTVLSHFEEGGSNRPFFNETMMAMVGIAAVGLRGGKVIIVDLGIDDPNVHNASLFGVRNVRSLAYSPVYVHAHEYLVATKRHSSVAKRQLISLVLINEPEDEMDSNNFYYCKPVDGRMLSVLALSKNSVAVSCIEYIPAIGSLLVGFTCGGFQIWRVNNLELVFSSDPVHLDRDVPVYSFSFQQPVDDPKNFCFVWVMYGNNSAECTDSTFVELHSLLYNKKSYVENFGFIYEDFKQCAKRMKLALEDDFALNDSDVDSSIHKKSRPIRLWTQPDSELMFCIWEVQRGGTFYVGVFDLNQWYSNHTKEYVYFEQNTGLCPYWVALPVEIPEYSNMVLDVRITPKSIMRWETPHAKLDIHLYPASLSFRAVCLTSSGVSAFEHFGVQEKLIRILLKDGPFLMIQPGNLKTALMRYGLEPVFQLAYDPALSLKERDRYYILTVLLENRRTAVITRFASVWIDGSHANAGCTIDLIIDWIAIYMNAIRGGADEHWETLFNGTDGSVSPETIHFINFSNFAWIGLQCLLQTLMKPSEVYSARGLELEDLEFALSKLVQFSSFILLLHKAKLLPKSEDGFLKSLREYYEQRRSEAKNTLEAAPYVDDQFKTTHPLMIDHLMDSLLIDEDLYEAWHVQKEEALYPPQHIGYLANMFMLTEADPRAVARVVMYFLIDLNYFFSTATNNEDKREIQGNFRAVLGDSSEEYQEIMDLWLLDHGVYDQILVHLKEKDKFQEEDGLPWCAATVALAAGGYEIDVAELLLKSCPKNLTKLLFSLMTSSVSRYDALVELMLSNNVKCREDLIQEFFQISDSRDYLKEFIRKNVKSMPAELRKGLLDFLQKSTSFRNLSQLLIYYVHLEDYQKLEEEFNRIREILQFKDLPEAERRTWKFQENYINHLLSTTRKKSVVGNFLQFKTAPTIRHVKSTIKLPVSAATPDPYPPATVKLFRTYTKLSDTLVNDPLSPLRRYAGKIKNAEKEAEIESQNREIRKSRRFSNMNSRMSLSTSITARRKTISSRTPVANKTFGNIPEESKVRDRLNRTWGSLTSASIDLIRILKPPSVDHRIEKVQTLGASFGSNSTLNGIQTEEMHVHSIMKVGERERDSSKKKIGLRFENEQMNSSDEDKDGTIYEDADQNISSESCISNDIANTGFEESFDTAGNRSFPDSEECGPGSAAGIESPAKDEEREAIEIPEFRSGNVDEIVSSQEVEAQTSSHGHTTRSKSKLSIPASSSRARTPTPTIDVQLEEQDQETEVKTQTKTRDTKHLSKETIIEDIQQMDETLSTSRQRRTSRSRTPTRDTQIDNSKEQEEEAPATPAKVSRASDENLEEGKSMRAKTRAGNRSFHETEECGPSFPVSEECGPSFPDSEECGPSFPDSEECGPSLPDSEECGPGSAAGIESPAKDEVREAIEIPEFHSGNVDEIVSSQEVEAQTSSHGHAKRSKSKLSIPASPSRARTPTRDIQMEEQGQETKVKAQTNTTDTKNLPKETIIEDNQQMDETLSTSRQRRTSRSRTPTRDTQIDNSKEEEAPARVRTRGASRGRTPTRDVDELTDEPEGSTRRGKKRTAASITPTKVSQASDENLEEGGQITRAKTRAASRAKTPTPTRDIDDTLAVDSAQAGTRTPTRDIQMEEQGQETKVKAQTKTRDTKTLPKETIIEDNQQMEETLMTSRQRRTSRSRTPTRDTQIDNSKEQEEEAPARVRTRRASRGRTPTRETQIDNSKEQEEEAPARVRTRGASRGRTPTRDVDELTDEPEGSTRRGKKRTAASITPTKVSQASDENLEEGGQITRAKTRAASRAKTPTRDIDDTPAVDSAQAGTRTPTRDIQMEEQGQETKVKAQTKTRDTKTLPKETIIEDNQQMEETLTTSRQKRTSRSRTPTRDTQIDNSKEEEAPARVRTRGASRGRTPSRDVDELTDDSEGSTRRGKKRTAASRTPTKVSEASDENLEEQKITRPKTRAASRAKTPTRESLPDTDDTLALDSAQAGTSMQKSFIHESLIFESTTVEDEEKLTTSKKSPVKPPRPENRRLRYFDHRQEMSTLIEDPALSQLGDSSLTSESVLETTLKASTPEPEPEPIPKKKVKGIKQRPTIEEEEASASTSTATEPDKPTKRRRKATVYDVDLDDDDDNQSEVGSTVSSISKSSVGSKKNTTKRGRGKGRKTRGGK